MVSISQTVQGSSNNVVGDSSSSEKISKAIKVRSILYRCVLRGGVACLSSRKRNPDELDELEEEIEREVEKWRIYRTLLKQLGAKQ